MVFIHNFWYANNHFSFGFLTKIGWVGVDLFFVLSGYLISNQIFKLLSMNQSFSSKRFIIRRLMRTAPNYLILVILYLIFQDFRDAPNIPSLWKIITFTSNLGLKTGTGFSYSWSLCIEEQFYILFPLIVLFISYKKSYKLAWWVIIFIFLNGMILRGACWQFYIHEAINPQTLNFKAFSFYQTNIYFQTLCRLDEILFGIIIAFLKNLYPKTWYRIQNKGNIIFFAGLIFSCCTCYLLLQYRYSFIMTVVGFPMLGISFGLLVISSLSSNSILYKTKIPGVKTIALTSYAIYLVEKPLNHLSIKLLTKYTSIGLNSIITFYCSVIFSIIGAIILYNCVEKPFIKIRDKICPTL